MTGGNRREILAMGAAVAASSISAQAFGKAAAKAAKGAGGMIVVNALGGLENPNLALTRPQSDNPVGMERIDMDDRTIADARASGLTAVNITLGYVGGPQEPYEDTIRTIAMWDDALRARPNDLLRVEKADDILRAKRENKIGLIYGFQNAAMMGNDASRVATFKGLGVRVIQLTYNPRNQLGDGSMVKENKGLTDFGREVVAQLNEHRIMVDLSHSGQNTCLDAARASKAPISINHTGCRALCDMPRNKTDEELKLVASKGGFVGIYFMPFLKADSHPHAEDVVAHIDHAVNVCGEDVVGIGTDGDVTGIDDMNVYRSFAAKQIADRAKQGLGATGETPDTYPFVIDLRGVDQFRKLEGLLKAKGYSDTRIEKIMGRNFLRYAKEIWG
ncbi:MAG TPA: membrane dipeptidase [Rhizomicrobium sp.]